jgi:hypothetical protein
MVIENINLSSDRNRVTLLWSNDTDLQACSQNFPKICLKTYLGKRAIGTSKDDFKTRLRICSDNILKISKLGRPNYFGTFLFYGVA